MIVSHLCLKNWRNFRAIEVDLRERVFLVGPNAVGKSNFLDSLRFLSDLAKPGGGLQKAVSDRGGISQIRCLSAPGNPNVEIKIDLAQSAGQLPLWRYELGVPQQTEGYRQSTLAYERVWHGKTKIVDRPNKSDTTDPLRLTQTFLEQINANAEFRDVAHFLESIQYLHLIPQVVRHPSNFGNPGLSEDPFGRTFLERIDRVPDQIRKERLAKIEEILKTALPQLQHFSDTKDDQGMLHLEIRYEHWKPGEFAKREDQFSDGTLRLVSLLWALLEENSILLLEEPESSIHPKVMRDFSPIIYRLQRSSKKQILMSTHSPDFLSDKGIGGEEVLLFQPTQEGTTVEVASEIQNISLLLEGGLSIADALIA